MTPHLRAISSPSHDKDSVCIPLERQRSAARGTTASRSLCVALIFVALCGCKKPNPGEGGEYYTDPPTVTKIGTTDGCDVYRIQDGGLWSHFARCPNTANTTVERPTVTYQAMCGKTPCTHTIPGENTPTVGNGEQGVPQ